MKTWISFVMFAGLLVGRESFAAPSLIEPLRVEAISATVESARQLKTPCAIPEGCSPQTWGDGSSGPDCFIPEGCQDRTPLPPGFGRRPIQPAPFQGKETLGVLGEKMVGVQKSLGDGDMAGASSQLERLFSNGGGARDGAASASPVMASYAPRALAPSKAQGGGFHIVEVPSPIGPMGRDSKNTLPLGAAGVMGLAGAGFLLLADSDADKRNPESQRNNPQKDPDVRRGYQDNQNRNSPEYQRGYKDGATHQQGEDTLKKGLDILDQIGKGR